MATWFEIKVRGMLGSDEQDDKEIVILGRTVKWTNEGIRYEADPRHRRLILEHFGFEDGTRPLSCNGDKDGADTDECDLEDLGSKESTLFRGLAARGNYLSLDCPDLQFPVNTQVERCPNQRMAVGRE